MLKAAINNQGLPHDFHFSLNFDYVESAEELKNIITNLFAKWDIDINSNDLGSYIPLLVAREALDAQPCGDIDLRWLFITNGIIKVSTRMMTTGEEVREIIRNMIGQSPTSLDSENLKMIKHYWPALFQIACLMAKYIKVIDDGYNSHKEVDPRLLASNCDVTTLAIENSKCLAVIKGLADLIYERFPEELKPLIKSY